MQRWSWIPWCAVAAASVLAGPEAAGAVVEGRLREIAAAAEANARFELIRAWAEDPAQALRSELAEPGAQAALLAAPAADRAVLEFLGWRFGLAGYPAPEPAAASDAAAEARGLLLVSIDTLRADHLGAYGYERATSPTLDALAERGALFERALSPTSWTLPSHMSAFTGLYPSSHGLTKGGRFGSARLADEVPLLAERLREAGFATAGIGTHGFLAPDWGFDRGFDVYQIYPNQRARPISRIARLWLDWHRFQAARGLAPPSFFLFVHFIDPHERYAPPPPYDRVFLPDYTGPLLRKGGKIKTTFESDEDFEYLVAQYDGEIAYTDRHLGRLLDAVGRADREASSWVAVFSDHGEEFLDHGYMGHKHTLYGEQLNVPLILAGPGVPPGIRIAEPVSLVDVTPTLLSLLGLDPIPGAEGRSLDEHWRMGPPLPPRPIYAELGPAEGPWERDYRRDAVHTRGHKLIRNRTDAGEETREVYDLARDPDEQRDLAATGDAPADVLAALEEALAHLDAKRAADERAKGSEFTIDPAVAEELKALGYME